jgi:SAM-dependent methyltransferase
MRAEDVPELPEPRLYAELAEWWPLLSAPEDYAEEADFVRQVLAEAGLVPPATLLELGSGGGNTASHLRAWFTLTLVDRSAGMLAVSQDLNPGVEHVQGDMRSVRLGRSFDAVLVHDAVMYLVDEADLAALFETAGRHCRPGGVLAVMPDHVAETFRPQTDHGGHDASDGSGRALRYLEWDWEPEPGESQHQTLFAIVLREADGTSRLVEDRHTVGLFPRATWQRLLAEAGFRVRTVIDPWDREVFIGVRDAGPEA